MEKKKEFIINIIFYGIILVLVYFGFKYILPPLIPFVIAFVMVYVLKKPIKAICRKFNLSNLQAKIASVALLLIFYVLTIGILTLLVIGCISVIKNFVDSWPSLYSGTIMPFFDMLLNGNGLGNIELPSEIVYAINVIVDSIDNIFSTIMSFLSSFFIGIASSLITNVPNFFISVVVCVIASFFIMIDYEKITGYAIKIMNDKVLYYYLEIKNFLFNKVFVIIKAYLKIMSITFIELFIGFTIIQLDSAFLVALSIAIFDILPVFGTGGIMIPWTIICLIRGNYVFAIELLVIYIIVTIIRNIIEPKIVGAELGLHPLVTLASMLVGVSFFGILGLFGFPIGISFILYEWKEKNKNKLVVDEK